MKHITSQANSLKREKDTRYLLIGLLSLFPLIAAGIIAHSKHISGLELTVFRGINNLSDSLFLLMISVTQLGTIGVSLLAVTAFIYYNRKRIVRRDKVTMYLIVTSAYIGALAVKFLVNRPRPSFILTELHLRGPFQLGLGFPSGHCTEVAAVVIALFPFVGTRYRYLLAFVALAVAFSRVYLGVHAPLDAIGGLFLGAAIACLIHFFRGTKRLYSDKQL